MAQSPNTLLGWFWIAVIIMVADLIRRLFLAITWIANDYRWLQIIAAVLLVAWLTERFRNLVADLGELLFGWMPDWFGMIFGVFIGTPGTVLAIWWTCVFCVRGKLPVWLGAMLISTIAFLLIRWCAGPKWSLWKWARSITQRKKRRYVEPPQPFGRGYVGDSHETYKAGL